MSTQSWKYHKNNPGNQPFNINGKHTTKKGWWRKGHNNVVRKSDKADKGE